VADCLKLPFPDDFYFLLKLIDTYSALAKQGPNIKANEGQHNTFDSRMQSVMENNISSRYFNYFK
jgi:hypothetical protein